MLLIRCANSSGESSGRSPHSGPRGPWFLIPDSWFRAHDARCSRPDSLGWGDVACSPIWSNCNLRNGFISQNASWFLIHEIWLVTHGRIGRAWQDRMRSKVRGSGLRFQNSWSESIPAIALGCDLRGGKSIWTLYTQNGCKDYWDLVSISVTHWNTMTCVF